jgi:TrmH family RNA methyltransferase
MIAQGTPQKACPTGMKITSVQNPRVKAAVRLRDRKERDEQGRIIIDGVREMSRALGSGVDVVELFYAPELCREQEHERLLERAEQAGVELLAVTPQVMEKLAFGDRVEGVVAVARRPQRTLADLKITSDSLVAIVEGVEKPGNLGAIVRTADAIGMAALIVADGRMDLYNPNAIRASLGAVFAVPVCSASTESVLAWLRQNAFRLIAARVDGSMEYTQADFRGPVAIALGSEAYGLSQPWRADDILGVRLPMVGSVDSLNLSATAAVLFYEALRQRRGTSR